MIIFFILNHPTDLKGNKIKGLLLKVMNLFSSNTPCVAKGISELIRTPYRNHMGSAAVQRSDARGNEAARIKALI